MRKGWNYIVLSLLVATVITANQLGLLFLHDHQPADTECHSKDYAGQADQQLHNSECFNYCHLCGLFFSKIQVLGDQELFLFHPIIKSYQTRRLLAQHPINFLNHNPRGPPNTL